MVYQHPSEKLYIRNYKEFLKAEKQKNKINWDLLDACYADEHREFQYFVVDYLTTMKKFITYDDLPHLMKYMKTKQWWDTIDGFTRIIGHIGLKDARIHDLMLIWSKDDDFWIRRMAINHQLGRKAKTNTQ